MNTIHNDKQGEFNSGWSRNVPGQRKKLAKQMTTNEINYLANKVKRVNEVVLHPHLLWKRDSGQISFDVRVIEHTLSKGNIKNLIKEYSVIKLKDGKLDHRVVLRSNKTEVVRINERGHTKCNLMFVLSLDTNEIITAYYVHIDNHFDNPNMDRYDEKLDVIKTLRSGKREKRTIKQQRPVMDESMISEWLDIFTEA